MLGRQFHNKPGHASQGEPANPRLWATVVQQAKGKFDKYPSPAASHWVHQEYVNKGGTFKKTKPAKKK